MDQSFPKSARLLKRREFDRTFDEGTVLKDHRLVIHCADGLTDRTRLGIVIGSYVKKAVRRNRLKRVIRAGFRTIREELPEGYDLVIIPRNTVSLTSDEVRDSLRTLLTEKNMEQDG